MSKLGISMLAVFLVSSSGHSNALDGPQTTVDAETRDVSDLLRGNTGAFVAWSGGRTITHDPERAAKRFVPASTFKIANMLIALETGVASGPDFSLPWDGHRPTDGFWPPSWSRDHTLQTAMRNGVVWYYQEIVRRIGRERMADWVNRFDYGNRDASGAIDRFWLDGPLAISAREQVEFIRRFLEDRLGLSKRTSKLAREILVIDEQQEYTLSGKTGTLAPGPQGYLTWFVGYVELSGETIVFALNLSCENYAACDHLVRREMVLEILRRWDLLPEEVRS